MTGDQMRQYLAEVGQRLAARGLTGEIVLAGGAVMVLALRARGGSGELPRDVQVLLESLSE